MLGNQISPLQQPMIVVDRSSMRRSNSLRLYKNRHTMGVFVRFVTKLTGRTSDLKDLANVNEKSVISRHYQGLLTVELDQILGSEGRSHDFDVNFNPLQRHTQSRWLSIANARQEGLTLPPISLIKIGNAYYVRDGHHRISVAKAIGERFIEAEVLEWRVADQKCSILGCSLNPIYTG